MRIMGLDFGSKTVGVAISDPLFLTAQGIEIVRRKSQGKLRQTLARIEELKEEYEVGKIVLGFPKNMNNTEGERCEKTLEFKEMLEKRTGLEVVLWDERLTTVEADRTMMQVGIRRENRKEYVDELAAIFILQGYLDYQGRQHTRKGRSAMEKIIFTDPENQEDLELYLLEQTCINGTTYLLAAEEEEEDSVAYILKEVQTENEDVIYAMVEDDVELNAISKVFAEILDDVDIEM